PTYEAVSFQNQPLTTLDLLWNGLHSTYNSASGRAVDFSVLDELGEDRDARERCQFSLAELLEALQPTSNRSSLGPDHVTWRHWKRIAGSARDCVVVVVIANCCLRIGYWPSSFKDSRSVIIPKPGKPHYKTTKMFRPIVLLNTLGKWVEKMLANRLQFE